MSVNSYGGLQTTEAKKAVSPIPGTGAGGILQISRVCSVGPADNELMCCTSSPDGRWLACGDSNGAVSVVQEDSGQVVYRLHSPQHSPLPVTAARFRRTSAEGDGDVANILLVGYSSGYVNLWHVTSQKCLASIHEDRQVLAVDYTMDCKQFATAGSDRAIYVYDSSTSKPVNTLEPSMDSSVMDGHMSRVYALRCHPSDPKILLSGGWDDTVQFWDTRLKHSFRKIHGPHLCGDALDIEPFTLNVLTGSWRTANQVEIWDFGTGKLLRKLQPGTLNSKVYGCCWMGPRSVLVGGSLGHRVVSVDVQSDTVTGQIGPLSHGVYGVDFCHSTTQASFVAGRKAFVCNHLQSKPKMFLTQEP